MSKCMPSSGPALFIQNISLSNNPLHWLLSASAPTDGTAQLPGATVVVTVLVTVALLVLVPVTVIVAVLAALVTD